MKPVIIRAAGAEDRTFVAATLTEHFASTEIFSRGRMFDALVLPGFVADRGSEPVGLAVCRFEEDECELLCLVAVEPRGGVGSLLLEFCRGLAAERGCRRLFLTTTNDNVDALRFYQRRGMRLAALHPGAMDRARVVKPEIPAVGYYGIPIRDDLELEYVL
jgi:ribosomal protein S18 acetylase RimI-like enzyme